MISCTEFILAYSELFSFLEERHGKESVLRLWEELADVFLVNLRDLVAQKGLAGMHEYWSHTLSEEGGDYSLSLTDDEFHIEMRSCPSVGILRRSTHIRPYPDYCEHCTVLYRRAIEPFGYLCEVDIQDPVAGRCRLTVTPKQQGGGREDR